MATPICTLNPTQLPATGLPKPCRQKMTKNREGSGSPHGFSHQTMNGNRRPTALPLLRDPTASLCYKMIVSFSAVTGFFLNLFKSNNSPNAKLNHPFTSLFIGEPRLCFASIAACNFRSVCKSNGQQRGCSPTSLRVGETLCPALRTENACNPAEAPKGWQDHAATSRAGLLPALRQTGRTRDGRAPRGALLSAKTEPRQFPSNTQRNILLFKEKAGPRLRLVFVTTPNCLRSARLWF